MTDPYGDYFARQMACMLKRELPKTLMGMKTVVDAVEEGGRTAPMSDMYKTVEAIMMRLYAEAEASYERAYVDLDTVLHGGDVLVVTEIPMEEGEE